LQIESADVKVAKKGQLIGLKVDKVVAVGNDNLEMDSRFRGNDRLLKIWYIYIMRDSKGQNMVEYVLLVTAVLLVCIYFFKTSGPFSNSINASLNSIVNQINNINNQIQF